MDELTKQVGVAWEQGHKAGWADGWNAALKVVKGPAFMAYLEGGDCSEARRFRDLVRDMLDASRYENAR